MVATHLVRDKSNNIVGFIVENKFYNVYTIKSRIAYIDNLSLTNETVIKATNVLPEVQYSEVVNKKEYQQLIENNPFERDIQKDFLRWKNSKTHRVLQLDGSRQIGKTTELKKFAYSNYEYVIYISLADDTFKFIDVVRSGYNIIDMNLYCCRASLPNFVNDKSTVIIIDEIQNSKEVYNSIRTLEQEFQCDIIVTGSYLGRILGDSEFFLPAGNLDTLKMTNMSFSEFCRAFQCEHILFAIDLYGNSSDLEYHRMQELYDLYVQIGGYPEVVKTFLNTNSIDACHDKIAKLLSTFKAESRVYFHAPREVEIFESVYFEALKDMCNERRGAGKNVIEKITKIVKDKTELIVNKTEVSNAIVWLIYTGILGVCNLATDGNINNISYARRLYFSDCGIASYVARYSSVDKSLVTGLLAETFVYNELHRLFLVELMDKKVLLDEVCFATYNNYELDFIIADLDRICYGIEVKASDGVPHSLKVFIDKRLVEKGIVVKPSKGGHNEKFNTIPIYTVGCRFPYK